MDNFTFCSPTLFVFGRDQENNAGKYVKQFGGTKVLLHYGGSSAEKSGLLGRVENSLKREGISWVKLGGVQPNPKSPLIYEGIELCRKEGVDFILAVGGGSVIDSAKAIGLGVVYEGDIWELYSKQAAPAASLPVGTVLTIAAAGSEGSNGSVVSFQREDGVYKRDCGGEFMRPKFSILNPALTQTLPPYQTACGIVDIMCHVHERYFTNTEHVEITDQLCEGVLRTLIKEGPKVMKNPNDYEARANIMWAGTMAHNDICGVGREQDWASHNLEHELSGLYNCAHGAGLAVIMPAWMDYVMKHDIKRFARYAVNVWGCEKEENPANTARAGIAALRKFWKSLGMPLNFQQLGAREEDIPLLLNYLQIEGRTEGHFVKLGTEDCRAIYQLAADYPG